MHSVLPVDKILSSGTVVVHHDGERYRFLVLRVFDSWDFPKRRVEADEDPLEVALAYTREVTGIDDLALEWGEEHRETVPYDDGSVTRYYMARTKLPDVHLRVPAGAGSDEDFEFRWVTADEAEDVLPPRLAIVLDWAVRMLVSSVSSASS